MLCSIKSLSLSFKLIMSCKKLTYKMPVTGYGVYTTIQTHLPYSLIRPPNDKDISIIYRSYYDLSEHERIKLDQVARINS